MTLSLKNEGDLLYLLGKNVSDIACSEYLYSYHQQKASPAPYFDLEEEFQLHKVIGEMIHQGYLSAVHDISDGGLFTTLAESAMAGGFGFTINSPSDIRKDAFLFGEAQGRAMVSLSPSQQERVEKHLETANVPYLLMGKVTTGDLVVDKTSLMSLAEASKVYESALGQQLG